MGIWRSVHKREEEEDFLKEIHFNSAWENQQNFVGINSPQYIHSICINCTGKNDSCKEAFFSAKYRHQFLKQIA